MPFRGQLAPPRLKGGSAVLLGSASETRTSHRGKRPRSSPSNSLFPVRTSQDKPMIFSPSASRAICKCPFSEPSCVWGGGGSGNNGIFFLRGHPHTFRPCPGQLQLHRGDAQRSNRAGSGTSVLSRVQDVVGSYPSVRIFNIPLFLIVYSCLPWSPSLFPTDQA